MQVVKRPKKRYRSLRRRRRTRSLLPGLFLVSAVLYAALMVVVAICR